MAMTQSRFAWLPAWVHIEYPPWGLGRFRCKRREDLPQDPEVRLNRDRRVILFWTGVAFLALLTLLGLMLSGARAGDLPCPPKHYFCWEVKQLLASSANRRCARRLGN